MSIKDCFMRQQVQNLLTSCTVDTQGVTLVINAPDEDMAEQLSYFGAALAEWILQKGKQLGTIKWPGGTVEYPVPVWLATMNPASNGDRTPSQNTESDLLFPQNSDYTRVLEFMLEKKYEGKIVILTSQVDDRCIHTNDNLLPSRSKWKPHQFNGYDYRHSWSLEGNGNPSDEYRDMRDRLCRDGYAPGFDYRLIRPADGALVEYQTDFYHIVDYCGEPIRIGVSNPEDYRVLQENYAEAIALK